MQVRKLGFACAFAGLASFPVWGGFSLALEKPPQAAVEIAPLVAARLQYEAFPPGETVAQARPTGFEVWAFGKHRAARERHTRPLAATCAVSGFGNAPL
jgi:hypothetical protein